MDVKQDSKRELADKGDPQSLLYGRVEAQWVLAVLDDCAKKLGVCSHLTSEILKDKIMDRVDHELLVALQEHFPLERGCIRLANSIEALEASGEDPKSLEEKKKLFDVVSDSTRALCGLLNEQHNSIVVRTLRELSSGPSASALEYLNNFDRLRRLVHAKLKMTAEEERQIELQQKDLEKQREKDDKKWRELSAELTAARKENTENNLQKGRKIARLKKQIQSVQDRAKKARRELKESMATEEAKAKKEFDETHAELTKQLGTIEGKLKDDSRSHWDREMTKHARVWTSVVSKAHTVKKAIEKYDHDLQEKHEALIKLEKQHDTEQKLLARLREDYRIVREENKRVEREIKKVKDTRDVALLKDRKVHHASVLMLKLFSRFQTREAKARKAAERAKRAEAKEKAG